MSASIGTGGRGLCGDAQLGVELTSILAVTPTCRGRSAVGRPDVRLTSGFFVRAADDPCPWAQAVGGGTPSRLHSAARVL